MTDLAQRDPRNVLQLAMIAALGSVFSLGLYYVWTLELRWLVVIVAALIMLSVAMCFVSIFSDFLTVALFFCLPLMSFNKWFWPSNYGADELGNLVYGGMFGLGLLDFILVGLYISWFHRLFVERSEPFPIPNFIDIAVLVFIALHLLSTVGAADAQLGLHSTEYLVKYALLYFYLSRNLRPAHLPWFLAALGFTVLLETSLGGIQHFTGKWLGIALDKGAGGSALDYQYIVPGLESKSRATGSTYDSHALGNLMGMIIPFGFVMFLAPLTKGKAKAYFLFVTVLALCTLVFSFSRSAWLGSAIGLAIGIVLILNVWRESQVVVALAMFGALVLVTLPLSAGYIYDRFEQSPVGTITTRFEQYQVAFEILQRHPIFGVGPGNYMEALKRYDTLWLEELPVHNVMLWIATETGLLGLLCYLAILWSATTRFFAAFSRRRDLAGRLAMAGCIALFSCILDGLTDPLFREPSIFTFFWILVALSVALPNFPQGHAAYRTAKTAPPAGPASEPATHAPAGPSESPAV